MSLLSKATSNRPVHRISNGQQCTPVNDEKVAIKHILQYRETKTKGRLKIYLASHCGNCGSSVCKQRTLYIKGILVDLKRPFLVHLIGLKQWQATSKKPASQLGKPGCGGKPCLSVCVGPVKSFASKEHLFPAWNVWSLKFKRLVPANTAIYIHTCT